MQSASPLPKDLAAGTAPRFPLYIGLLAIGLLLLAPLMIYPVFLMKVMLFGLFACAFNLLIGFTGLLSFGHAMFFGGAAYMSAYTMKNWGFSPELGILSGVVFAAAMGLVTGLLAIRRHGIYFAMITLALAQMFFFLCLQTPLTGGEDGIQSVPRRPLLGFFDIRPDIHLYYVVLAIFLFGLFVIVRTIHSPFGQVLKAIRENEPRSISLGYRADRYKLQAFVLSSAIAGLAGGTKVLVFQLASLTDVSWNMSGEVILMTLIGGMGTLFGPIVGAAIVVTVQNYLGPLGEWVLVIQGAIFVIAVSLFRRGLVGELGAVIKRRSLRTSQ